MLPKLIALLIILFLVFKLIRQKQKHQIKTNEFWFWLIFWLVAGGLIIFIRTIDRLVASLGFSSSGINVVLYLAVVFLFYFIFRLRLKLVKIDQDLTAIIRTLALNTDKEKNMTEVDKLNS